MQITQNKPQYTQKSVIKRIEALFLDNIGTVITRERIIEAATNPISNKVPENWHQRVSELRTIHGYTILTKRDCENLKVSEYLMPDAKKRRSQNKRLYNPRIKDALIKENPICRFPNCGLKEGDIDPIGGGTVRLQLDHMSPHSLNSESAEETYQLLCGRHNIIKKNFWDDQTGKLNVIAILQSASKKDKLNAYDFLRSYFN